jgi:hypothetical protein
LRTTLDLLPREKVRSSRFKNTSRSQSERRLSAVLPPTSANTPALLMLSSSWTVNISRIASWTEYLVMPARRPRTGRRNIETKKAASGFRSGWSDMCGHTDATEDGRRNKNSMYLGLGEVSESAFSFCFFTLSPVSGFCWSRISFRDKGGAVPRYRRRPN